MNDINRSEVLVDLRDVRGRNLRDKVRLKLYNQRAQSLNQSFDLDLKGRPVRLKGVPAFPFGLAEVFISPTRYRFKSVFLNVPVGAKATISESFFVDADRVHAVLPSLTDIRRIQRWVPLWRILQASGLGTAASWNGLNELQKAGLLNLYAKCQRELADGTTPITNYLKKLCDFRPARVLATVDDSLLDHLRTNGIGFHSVPGTLHEFPQGWQLIKDRGSFKTYDKAGNLQLTFAQNADGQLMADIDIDDHQGIKHAADVLKHKITGKDTHPFDIHEILFHFQGLDPGYELV